MKNNVEIYGGFNPANNTTDWNTRTLPNKGLGDGSVLDGQNVRPVIWNYNNRMNTTAILDGLASPNGPAPQVQECTHGLHQPWRNLWIKEIPQTSDGGSHVQHQFFGFASNDQHNLVLTTRKILEEEFQPKQLIAGTTNVNIDANTASEDGGGMYNDVSVSPLMTNVSRTGNSAKNGQEVVPILRRFW